MQKFFNVIPSEGNTACILLYGDIGDSWDGCDARSVKMELMELQATYDRIDVRINSYGGDVYAGLAIFNALKSSTADIHIYVDGVAASMAAVIALCGKPVQMSQYASLMLHSASTGIYGNKQEMAEVIKKLEALDATLASIVAPRLKMETQDVLAKYFDGEDHWIEAAEAKTLGLVDALYDVEDITAHGTLSHHGAYMVFNNRLRHQAKPKNQSNSNQMSKVILEAVSGMPVFASCADDEAVRKKIAEVVAKADKAEELEKQVEELGKQVQQHEEEDKKRKDAEIAKELDEAEASGIITKDDRGDVEALLRSNPEAARKMLAKLAVHKPRRVSDFLSEEHPEPQEGLKRWDDRMREINEKNK